MDKRMVGKWYKDELEETLNIFDETPPRMKMSLASSGHYDFEPMRVRESDGFLCFEINDEYYRMVYTTTADLSVHTLNSAKKLRSNITASPTFRRICRIISNHLQQRHTSPNQS